MQELAPHECHVCLAMATREWYMSHKRVCATLPVICTVDREIMVLRILHDHLDMKFKLMNIILLKNICVKICMKLTL